MEGQNKNMRWKDKIRLCCAERTNKNIRCKDKIRI